MSRCLARRGTLLLLRQLQPGVHQQAQQLHARSAAAFQHPQQSAASGLSCCDGRQHWWRWQVTPGHYATTIDISKEAEDKESALEEKYDYLADKDVWDEAWAYEPRFGTVESPIVVPSTDAERIIGVTDPQDDTLVIWGIIREKDPPRQLVEGGEFFVLNKVEVVPRVGDILNKELT